MAKRQGPRPTVRISRDAGSGASGQPPANRRPIRQQSPPDVRQGDPAERVRFPARSSAPAPRSPRPAYGDAVSTLPTPLTVPGRAIVGTPTESAARLPAPVVARSGATRTREAGLRLFGDYSYVKRDLRRIAVLTLSALVLLVILSFLLPLWLK